MTKHLLYTLLLMIACQSEQVHQQSSLVLSEGTNMAAAFSPTQDEIVVDVLGRLWLMPIDGGELSAITDPLGNARQPSWSPDGQQIAFQAYWSGHWQIYRVQRDGTGLKQLTDGSFDNREPHWSPDGSNIFFASDRDGSYDIWKVNADGADLEKVTSQDYNQFSPVLAPDHQTLAYSSDDPEQAGIWRKDLATGRAERLYESEAPLRGLSWSPDQSVISFVEQPFGKSLLRYINPDNRELQASTLVEDQDVFPFRTSWRNNDEFIYTANGKLYRSHLNRPSPDTIPFSFEIPLSAAPYDYKTRSFDAEQGLTIKGLSEPQLSPDGHSVAVVMLEDLWMRNQEGDLQQLTDDHYYEISPAWSPDGGAIAYLSDKSGQFDLYVHDIATGDTRKLAPITGTISGIAWSPDGSKIAISTNYGPRIGRLGYQEVKTAESHWITPMLTSSISAPSWAPDGRRIAVGMLQPFSTLYREGVNGVIYYSLAGEIEGRLQGVDHMSIGARGKDGPIWSPDGQHIAAISSGELWLLPIDASGQLRDQPKKLTEGLADFPSWSGDGQEILYATPGGLQKINIASKQKSGMPIGKTWDRKVPSSSYTIHAGTLFDGMNEQLLSNVDVIVHGNRISEIRPHSDQIEGTLIDASKQFVMPGLIEGHSHQGSYFGEKLDRAWLAWGVTSTRDPASDPYDALNRREARESGKISGPRVFYTGSPIDGSRIYYPGASALSSERQIDLELERAAALDYDLIKTYVRLSDPMQKKVIEGAHEIGIPVSSHELYPAVTFGVDGVEHISGTSRRGYSAKFSHLSRAYNDVTSLIARSGMTFTPTTGIYVSFNYLLERDPAPLKDPRVVAFAAPNQLAAIRAGIENIGAAPDGWKLQFENTLRMVKDVHEKGGLVTAGTDSPIIPYGFSLHLELQAYVEAGLSTIEVLRTCTSNASRLLHAHDDLGTIEAGKLADIVILNSSPVQDIRNTRSVDKVMANGELHLVSDLLNP